MNSAFRASIETSSNCVIAALFDERNYILPGLFIRLASTCSPHYHLPNCVQICGVIKGAHPHKSFWLGNSAFSEADPRVGFT